MQFLCNNNITTNTSNNTITIITFNTIISLQKKIFSFNLLGIILLTNYNFSSNYFKLVTFTFNKVIYHQ